MTEASEIEKPLNKAIWNLVFSSLYLGAAVWFICRGVQKGGWLQITGGTLFVVAAISSIRDRANGIKKIFRDLQS